MLTETHILASNDGKDLLETVFFVVIALISVLGPIFNKFLKKSESDGDSSEITVDDSVFGEIEEDETPDEAFPPPPIVDYNATSAYDEQQRERHRRTLQAQSAECPRYSAKPVPAFGETFPPSHVPAQTFAPRTPHVPAPKQPASAEKPATTFSSTKTQHIVANDELLNDREALRRAVLAQEILSPPLALRER